jgi:plastocyanin
MSRDSLPLTNEASIEISKEGINPATIRLEAGQSITLNNTDEAPHALTADQDALPGFETSEPLNNGDTYSYTFEKKGTYRIYDPAAPQVLNATVVVE